MGNSTNARECGSSNKGKGNGKHKDRDSIGVIYYWDNGKENGSYYFGFGVWVSGVPSR